MSLHDMRRNPGLGGDAGRTCPLRAGDRSFPRLLRPRRRRRRRRGRRRPRLRDGALSEGEPRRDRQRRKTFEPQVRPAVEAAERLAADANRRERAHIAALRAFLDGEWRKANAIYGEILIDHPRDTLALQIAHALDFYLGQSALLRDRVARVLPHWSAHARYGFLLGMLAFGLEECGDYGRAETAGRGAIERSRDDCWAQPRRDARDGDAGARARKASPGWSGARAHWGAGRQRVRHSQLVAHGALSTSISGRIDACSRIYDELLRPASTNVQLQMLDAAAMLWRLHLQRADVGTAGTRSPTPTRRRPTTASTRSTTCTR